MDLNEQRIRIAEACGWQRGHTCKTCGHNPGWMSPLRDIASDPPDYLNDLNAMHEAEKVLLAMPANYKRYYASRLRLVLDYEKREQDGCPDLRETCDLIHATAAQRAEALLRTLNLWQEDSP